MIGDCKPRYDRENGNGRLKNPTAACHKHSLNRRTSSREVQMDSATSGLIAVLTHPALKSHDAVIRVYDEAGNVIETREHVVRFPRVLSWAPSRPPQERQPPVTPSGNANGVASFQTAGCSRSDTPAKRKSCDRPTDWQEKSRTSFSAHWSLEIVS
jgi:hypothetical protein